MARSCNNHCSQCWTKCSSSYPPKFSISEEQILSVTFSSPAQLKHGFSFLSRWAAKRPLQFVNQQGDSPKNGGVYVSHLPSHLLYFSQTSWILEGGHVIVHCTSVTLAEYRTSKPYKAVLNHKISIESLRKKMTSKRQGCDYSAR
jgi:hypothetical protein